MTLEVYCSVAGTELSCIISVKRAAHNCLLNLSLLLYLQTKEELTLTMRNGTQDGYSEEMSLWVISCNSVYSYTLEKMSVIKYLLCCWEY